MSALIFNTNKIIKILKLAKSKTHPPLENFTTGTTAPPMSPSPPSSHPNFMHHFIFGSLSSTQALLGDEIMKPFLIFKALRFNLFNLFSFPFISLPPNNTHKSYQHLCVAASQHFLFKLGILEDLDFLDVILVYKLLNDLNLGFCCC